MVTSSRNADERAGNERQQFKHSQPSPSLPLQPTVGKGARQRSQAFLLFARIEKTKANFGLRPPLETGMADRGIPPKTDSNSHSKQLWHLYKFFFGWAAESFATVERTYETVGRMSALPPKADIGTQSRDVYFVPKAGIRPGTGLKSRYPG